MTQENTHMVSRAGNSAQRHHRNHALRYVISCMGEVEVAADDANAGSSIAAQVRDLVYGAGCRGQGDRFAEQHSRYGFLLEHRNGTQARLAS